MTKVTVLSAGVAAALIGYGAYASSLLEARLERSEAALAAALERERALAATLAERASVDARPAPAPVAGREPCVCPDAAPCPAPQVIEKEVIVAPDGTRLASAADRDDYVRRRLSDGIERRFGEGEMDRTTRRRALDLLTRYRDLRMQGGSPDQLGELQAEFVEVTGMSVGEFLTEVAPADSPRSVRPGEAAPVPEGEVRKRFADEVARGLGVTEPGSVEVMRDGEWQPQ